MRRNRAPGPVAAAHRRLMIRLLMGMLAATLLVTATLPAPSPAGPFAAAEAMPSQAASQPIPRYVFLFIGDGMGLSLISLAESYLGHLKAPDAAAAPPLPLSFSRFPVVGLQRTHCAGGGVTDSAAAATAIATGQRTAKRHISISPDGHEAYASISEQMAAQGMRVGIISSSSLCDATPAAFYAHSEARSDYHAIAMQAAQRGWLSFLGGGGFRIPESGGQNAYDALEAAGFRIIDDMADIRTIQPTKNRLYVLSRVLNDKAAMPYELDRHYLDAYYPSLSEIVSAGIRALANNDGFFLVVEGGRIDGAAHVGDVKAALREVLSLSDCVAQALSFYRAHPDETLIIVTADHETGGLFFTSEMDFRPLSAQDVSHHYVSHRIREIASEGGDFDEAMSWVSRHFCEGEAMNFTREEIDALRTAHALTILPREEREAVAAQYDAFDGYTPFTIALLHILQRRSGIFFLTHDHTGTQVPVYAIGAGAEHFSGVYENTGLYTRLAEAMGNARE